MKQNKFSTGHVVLYCLGAFPVIWVALLLAPIAGEGLIGILLAIFAVAGIDSKIDLSSSLNLGWPGGIALIIVLIAATLWYSRGAKKQE